MTTSVNLGIPYVASSQSQPEVTHNDAINLIQALFSGAISIGSNSPPGSPSEGDVYVIGSSPTGAWANRANCITMYVGGAWVFVPGDDSDGTPISMGSGQSGLRIFNRADAEMYVWSDGGFSPDVFEWRELTATAAPAQDHGELRVTDNTTPISVTAAADSTLVNDSDYTQITGIWDAIPHGQNTGVVQSANSLTVTQTAVYEIIISVTGSCTVNNTSTAIRASISGVLAPDRMRNFFAASGTYNGHAIQGFGLLPAGTTIELFHAADKTCDIYWERINLTLKEVERVAS